MSFINSLFGSKPKKTDKTAPTSQTDADRKQLEQYVAAELQKAVPSGWRVVRLDEAKLVWTIEKVSIRPGEWQMQDFSLIVSNDLQWFIFTHGNNDVGVNPWLSLSNATVFPITSLRIPGSNTETHSMVRSLSECIQYLMKHRKTNEWGYT